MKRLIGTPYIGVPRVGRPRYMGRSLGKELGPFIAIRDAKTAQGADNSHVNLGATGTQHLDLAFSPGDLLIVIEAKQHFGTSGTGAQIVQATLPDGWQEIAFSSHPIAGGEDATGYRIAWKIAEVDEPTDNLEFITASGAGGTVTNRTVRYGFSYRIRGVPTVVYLDADSTTGDPADQVIPALDEAVPSLAFSFAAAASEPNQSYSETPDQNLAGGSTSGPALKTRVKTNLFLSNPADITVGIADLGNSNCLATALIVLGESAGESVIGPVNEVLPSITGAAVEGAELTGDPGVWLGNPAPSFTYKWLRDGVVIAGATSSTYTLVTADVGTRISFKVSADNGVGDVVNAQSSETGTVTTPGTGFVTFSIDSDFVDLDAPEGTDVGTFTGTGLISVELLDDAGGRFTLNGLDLKVGATAVDYEGLPDANGRKQPVNFYFITVRGTDGTDVVDKQFLIRARYPAIAPTGGQGGTETVVNSTSALRTQLTSSTPGRIITADELFNDIFEVNGNTSTDVDKSNFTLQGHPFCMGIKDKTFRLRTGDNQLIRDWTSGVGADAAGGSLDNRDSMEITSCSNVMFENCLFFASVDELCSVISGTGMPNRHVRFERCVFVEPLYEAGHSEGSHAFGPLAYNYQANIVFNKCVFLGCLQRSPAIAGRCRGVLIQNCVIAHSGSSSSQTGTSFYSPNSSVENGAGLTAICRGNLYAALSGVAHRLKCIELNRIGTGSYVYLPESGDYQNYYFTPGAVPDFTQAAITRADVQLRNGSQASSLVNFEPFALVDDYGLLPTTTELNRSDLFDDVMLNCGPHTRTADVIDTGITGGTVSKYLYDVLNNFLTTGTVRRQTPITMADQYGSDWKSGGTNGAMLDASP